MRFLLDANIPYSAKRIFSKSDAVSHVRDVGLANASDEEIIKRALKDDALLVTRDMDFANIIFHPIGTHAGVIVIRVPPYFIAVHINKMLKQFFSKIDKQVLPRAITIVEPGQYRIRR